MMTQAKGQKELWKRVAGLKRDDLDNAIGIVKDALDAGVYGEDMAEAVFMSMSEDKGDELAEWINGYLETER